MADLEDTFGEDFAEHVQERIQERRAERERISDETKAAIADKAINEEAFKEGDPMFDYTTDEGVTHDVLLMQLAEPREGSVWGQARQLDSGAVSVPLDYLGDWVWSIFNNEQMAKKMEEGKWYIVAGNLDTWEPDDGPPQDQLSPVRGVMSLEEAKELADGALEDSGFDESATETEDEEPEEEEVSEPEPEEEPEEGQTSVFGAAQSGDEDEEEKSEEEEEASDEPPVDVTISEVANVVEELGEEEEEVWEVTPDHEEFETFMIVVMDRLGLDPDDDEAMEYVAELALDRVEEGPAGDDDDDEDDSIFG